MTIVNAQTQRGGPYVAPGKEHDGKLERQYSVSAENYGRPSRASRFDMAYGGATPDAQYGELPVNPSCRWREALCMQDDFSYCQVGTFSKSHQPSL